MEGLTIQISPRMLCPCGKTVRKMTPEERQRYDDAVRRVEVQSESQITGRGDKEDSNAVSTDEDA